MRTFEIAIHAGSRKARNQFLGIDALSRHPREMTKDGEDDVLIRVTVPEDVLAAAVHALQEATPATFNFKRAECDLPEDIATILPRVIYGPAHTASAS